MAILIALSFASVLMIGVTLKAQLNLVDDIHSDQGSTLKAKTGVASHSFKWNRTWGEVIKYNQITGVAVDSSSNIYLAGYFGPNPGSPNNASLTKYDSTGTQDWSIVYGGSDPADKFHDVTVFGDNIYVVGQTESFCVPGNHDLVFLKLDSAGNIVWEKFYNDSVSNLAYGITVDQNHNIYITGLFGLRMGLVKYDASGVQQWNTTWLGPALYDQGVGVVVDTDGNIFVAAIIESLGNGGTDAFLIRYSPSGNMVWYKDWGGSADDVPTGIAMDSSRNIYITGYTDNLNNTRSAFLLKYNSADGNLLWSRVWNGRWKEVANDLTIDDKDIIYVTGATSNNPAEAGDSDIFIATFDTDGHMLWYEIVLEDWDTTGSAIALDEDKNIYIGGYIELVQMEYFLVKYQKGTGDGIPGFDILPIVLVLIPIAIFVLFKRKKAHLTKMISKLA